MLALRDIFPRYCVASPSVPDDDETPPFDWSNPPSVAGLIALVTADQNAAAADLDALNVLSLALYDDLLDQRRGLRNCPSVEAVDFVQFWAAVFPLANATGRRRFSMARDWAARALVDDYGASEVGQEVHIERIMRFGALADETLRAQVDHTLLEWTRHFFYLSSATGDLIEVARAAAPPLLRLAFAVLGGNEGARPLADDALGAAIALTQWLDRHEPGNADRPARLLGEFEDHEGFPEGPRKRVALLLSGPPGRRTPISLADRASRALSRYPHLLAGHERVALLASALAGRADEALSRLDEILDAIDEYLAFMADRGEVDRLYDRGRLFGQVGGLVRTLASDGHARAALRVLGRWYGVRDPRGDAVMLLAADPEGTRWIMEGRIEPEPGDGSTLSPLIRTANRALGLKITDIDSLAEGIPEPVRRPGFPNYAVAAEYERVCEEHLRLDGLVAQMEAGAPPAIIAIPGLPVPLPALARRATGVCHPLSVSLKTPLPDRAVRRVVVWASDIAGTGEETDAVAAVLTVRGVDVEIVREGRTVDAFAALYERDDIDVLWVACHGEHAPFEPEVSKLTLSDGHDLSLEKLLTLRGPESVQRRLIVLNACDSGTAAQFGGLADFGIGSAIAGPEQAVVAHLWPVGFTEAAGFGAVLASGLAIEQRYDEAFGRATAALEGGVEAMLEELSDTSVTGGLTARLDAARGRDHGLLHWGSPILIE